MKTTEVNHFFHRKQTKMGTKVGRLFIRVDLELLRLIDEARRRTFQTRSDFARMAILKAIQELLKESNKNAE